MEKNSVVEGISLRANFVMAMPPQTAHMESTYSGGTGEIRSI